MRKIIHVDMDCFYAAVEVKHNPRLRGLPLGIGGPAQSRSVLCTASYEARKYGVRAAMPSSMALRLCPQLVLVPPNFALYKQESKAVREIFERFTDQIEPLSLDEAYLDVTHCREFKGSATLIAREIRKCIFEELKLTASAGVAPNKFLAKVASDWRKPNNQFVIRPEEVADFVRELPVEKIFGVGKVTAQKMHELGLFTCADIQKTPLWQLRQWFGSRALELADYAQGIDDRPVVTDSERKSVSVEETFDRDLQTLEACLAQVPQLFKEWELRMSARDYRERLKGICVKVKYHDFKSTTHEELVRAFPKEEDFRRLLIAVWNKRAEPIRLLGVGAKLASSKAKEAPLQQLALL